MKNFKLDLEAIELIDALEASSKSNIRACTKFAMSSAAYKELRQRGDRLQAAANFIKAGLSETPLETAIANANKK